MNVVENPPVELIATEETTTPPLNFTVAVPPAVKCKPVTLTDLPGEEFSGRRRTFGAVDARSVDEYADVEIGTRNKDVM